MNSKMYWFNIKTGESEFIEMPSDFTDYLPQNIAAQNLYLLYQEMGDSPIEAAIKVFTTVIDAKKD